MITIGLVSNKGGVHKTTATIEIATLLKREGYRVLVVDTDQQANLSDYVNADRNKVNLYQVLKEKINPVEAIQNVGLFDVIAASMELSKADREFTDVEDIYLLYDMLEVVKDNYDFVLIDTAPAKSIILAMVIEACDYIISPAIADKGSVNGVQNAWNDIVQHNKRRSKIRDLHMLAIILSQYSDTNLDKGTLDTFTNFSDEVTDKPLVFTVRKSIKMGECKHFCQSIQDYDPKCKPAEDYRNIVNAIIHRLDGKDNK